MIFAIAIMFLVLTYCGYVFGRVTLSQSRSWWEAKVPGHAFIVFLGPVLFPSLIAYNFKSAVSWNVVPLGFVAGTVGFVVGIISLAFSARR